MTTTAAAPAAPPKKTTAAKASAKNTEQKAAPVMQAPGKKVAASNEPAKVEAPDLAARPRRGLHLPGDRQADRRSGRRTRHRVLADGRPRRPAQPRRLGHG
jgi:hypothetical protein